MNGQSITAPRLRIILAATIGLMIVAGVGAFFFFHQQLSAYATEVNNDNVAAAASNQDVAMLQRLKAEMADSQVAVKRAASIVAESKQYQYQNQIIDDLNKYAKAAGFNAISSFSFSDSSIGTTAPATSAGPTVTATPLGLKSVTATVTLPGAISYQSVMNFLKAIELNLTKMDLSGVTMQLDASSGKLTVNPIMIKVYTQ